MVTKSLPKQKQTLDANSLKLEKLHCLYCRKSGEEITLNTDIETGIVSCASCQTTMDASWLELSETKFHGGKLTINFQKKPDAISDTGFLDKTIGSLERKEHDAFLSVTRLEISPNASKPNFQTFPKSILKFNKMESLKILFCGIGEIPDEITRLKNLTALELNCGNLPLRVSDKICDLQKLEKLSLNNANLRNLPENIGSLKRLRELDISNNRGLAALPESICDLQNLEILNADDCSIEHLPKEIGRLGNLQELRLKSNRLTELPKSIGNLSKLKYLGLHSNDLGAGAFGKPYYSGRRPSLLAHFHAKTHMFLRRLLEPIACGRLPDSMGNLSSLEELYLDWNLLTRIPESLGNLKRIRILYLSNNMLKGIPKSLLNLTNMNEFDASNDSFLRNYEGPNKNTLNYESTVYCALLNSNAPFHKVILHVGMDAFLDKHPGFKDLRKKTLESKRKALGLSKKMFSELIAKEPQVLNFPAEKAKNLRSYFGKNLDVGDLRKLLEAKPGLLNVEIADLERKRLHLKANMKIFCMMVSKVPWLATCSWEWFIETEQGLLKDFAEALIEELESNVQMPPPLPF